MAALSRLIVPGLFVTGTDTGVGKTVIAGAIARSLRRNGVRVGVCKIAATACERRGDRLVSDDAAYLADWAQSREPLDVVCPQCWTEPLAPAVAAGREGRPIEWELVDRALRVISADSGCVVVEGVGGVRVPMDDAHTVADVIAWLGVPVVIVARPGLGTINHTLLTIDAVRSVGGTVAGVVINRFPAGTPDVAEQTNPAAIERWGGTKVLAIVPDAPFVPPAMPERVAAAIDAVNWLSIATDGVGRRT